MKPPKAKRKIKTFTLFNDKREDPYYWMNQKDSKDVLDLIKKENAYFDFSLKSQKPLQQQIFKELKSRIPQKMDSAPYRSKKYYYFKRFKEKKEYPIYCRKKSPKGPVEVLFDVNKMAQGFSYYNIGSIAYSDSEEFAAFAVDFTGQEQYTIFLKDFKKNKILPIKIENTINMVWSRDDTLFYTVQDPKAFRGYRVYRFHLKTKKKELIFEEKDKAVGISIYKSLSQKYIFIYCGSISTSECRFIPSDKPLSQFKIFKKRKKGLRYVVEDGGDTFYILHNKGKSKNFQLDSAPVNKTNQWTNRLPHNKDVRLEGFQVFEKWIVLEVRKNGLSQLLFLNRKTKKTHFLKLKNKSHFVTLGENKNYKSSHIRLGYASMTQPIAVYDYNPTLRTKKLIQKKKLATPYDPKKYQSLLIQVKVRDKTLVPISLLYKKSLFKKGQNPCLIYGYGASSISVDPYFQSNIFSLIDRGFVYAIAHIRGGGEKGKVWHEQGQKLNKKNTFYDFIDCSKALIRQGFSHPKKLYAEGHSAGGLLMGAVLNEEPKLYQALLAYVPFVDTLTTMLDTSLPMTPWGFGELGNPAQKKCYHYMKSYSPYDNIKRKDLPSVFCVSGYNDGRVPYWEPLKWVQKLRDHQTNEKNEIILSMDTKSGHFGAAGRFGRLKIISQQYAFLLQKESLQK